MESVSSIIPTQSVPGNGSSIRPQTPHTMPELVQRLRAIEARHNPDVVADLRTLRMSPEGRIEVPGLKGTFDLTPWARSSLGSRLGLSWRRYAEDAEPAAIADEVNRRLARASGEVRVRTASAPADLMSDGVVRAVVSAGYSSISDVQVSEILMALLEREDEVKVLRFDVTDMTTTYALGIGTPLNPNRGSEVGDIRGGLTLRNSGVGYASFFAALSIERLACKNGLVLSDDHAIRRTHRGIDAARLRQLLSNTLSNIGGRVREAADAFVLATTRRLPASVPDTIERLLVDAGLPKRLSKPIEEAYTQEPHQTVWGISQAVTLAAQDEAPEMRLALERLAGEYLRTVN